MVITSAVITAAIKRRLNQLFVEPRINDPLRKLKLLTHLFIAGLDLDWIGTLRRQIIFTAESKAK